MEPSAPAATPTDGPAKTTPKYKLSPVRYETTPRVGATFHQFAKLFPALEGEARAALLEDIRRNGVLEPIVFLGDAILDGLNRYNIARELLIAYPRVEFEGDDPLDFVLSWNLHRRHLNESQRAMIAAKVANMPHGGMRGCDQGQDANLRLAPDATEIGVHEARSEDKQAAAPATAQPPTTVAEAASRFQVSARLVNSARQVRVNGAPELIEAVETGRLRASAAAAIADLPYETQLEKLAEREAEKMARRRGAARPSTVDAADCSGEAGGRRGSIGKGAAAVRGASKCKPRSVDMVVASPPRGASREAYAEIARVAAKALRPGGFLVCIGARETLHEMLPALGRRLLYRTVFSCALNGAPTSDPSVDDWAPVTWHAKEVAGGLVDTDEKDGHLGAPSRPGEPLESVLKRLLRPGMGVLTLGDDPEVARAVQNVIAPVPGPEAEMGGGQSPAEPPVDARAEGAS